MKVGQKVNFYIFGALSEGIVYEINKEDNTMGLTSGGYQQTNGEFKHTKYPHVQTFKKLPNKKSDIPPWYILK